MNARTEANRLKKQGSHPGAWKPAGWPSPKLIESIGALSAYSLGHPDTTLEEVRGALAGTAFTWSRAGELTLSPERAALVSELDELIEAFGQGTRAAYLFPAHGDHRDTRRPDNRIRLFQLPLERVV